MSKILKIKAMQIFDSRGNPTVAVDLTTKDGVFNAKVPSGASTGVHEALELRDHGTAYGGKGVSKAVSNVNKKIAKKLIGQDCTNQEEIDKIMITLDGTENKARLGANAILGVSMAACRAGAAANNMPLYKHISKLYGNNKFIIPIPAFNIINGGEHAGNKLDIQEYMLLPTGAKSFEEAMRIGSEIYHELKTVIGRKYKKSATAVGDEGGFAPPISCYEEPFDLIADAVLELGYSKKVKVGMDAAASYFFRGGRYILEGKRMNAATLLSKYESLVKNHPLVSIEDPFQEEGFESFANITKKLGKKVQIVGDDLLVTNVMRIKKAIAQKSCNALLLKVNQIGSVSESLDAARMAIKANWNIMVSHRSGETTDDFIADLVVGLGTGQIKSGAPCRGERLSKYNRLLKIESELGRKASYAKWNR